mgnify:CR=1 FL=1
MQLTPNYNLKKPEETDPIDILDFNDNADLIDAALKKKAESSGGDISGMTVKTLDDITTEFPVPEAGESTKTFLGKVKKFFSDTKNWMTGVCLIGQIVNNCVTNNAKLPLSAAQGKGLMDLYTVLNTEYSNNFVISPITWTTAFNLWLSPGLYIVKHSVLAPNGASGISLNMEVPGGGEQQTDRGDNTGVRGVIGTNIYYLPSGGTYIGSVYVNHNRTATANNNLKILKLW